MHGSKQTIPYLNPPPKLQSFRWTSWWRNHTCVENFELEFRDKSKILKIFEFSENRDYDGRIKKFSTSIESSSAIVKRFIATLMEEIKPILIQ